MLEGFRVFKVVFFPTGCDESSTYPIFQQTLFGFFKHTLRVPPCALHHPLRRACTFLEQATAALAAGGALVYVPPLAFAPLAVVGAFGAWATVGTMAEYSLL